MRCLSKPELTCYCLVTCLLPSAFLAPRLWKCSRPCLLRFLSQLELACCFGCLLSTLCLFGTKFMVIQRALPAAFLVPAQACSQLLWLACYPLPFFWRHDSEQALVCVYPHEAGAFMLLSIAACLLHHAFFWHKVSDQFDLAYSFIKENPHGSMAPRPCGRECNNLNLNQGIRCDLSRMNRAYRAWQAGRAGKIELL